MSFFNKKNKKKVDLTAAPDKPSRAVKEIQEEYQQLAFRAGQCQYQIYTLERDLDLLNSKMRELNFEAAAAQQAESAKAVAEQKKADEVTENV